MCNFILPKEAKEYINNLKPKIKKEKRQYIISKEKKQEYKTRTKDQEKEYNKNYQIKRREEKINCPKCNREIQLDYLKKHIDNYICIKNQIN